MQKFSAIRPAVRQWFRIGVPAIRRLKERFRTKRFGKKTTNGRKAVLWLKILPQRVVEHRRNSCRLEDFPLARSFPKYSLIEVLRSEVEFAHSAALRWVPAGIFVFQTHNPSVPNLFPINARKTKDGAVHWNMPASLDDHLLLFGGFVTRSTGGNNALHHTAITYGNQRQNQFKKYQQHLRILSLLQKQLSNMQRKYYIYHSYG